MKLSGKSDGIDPVAVVKKEKDEPYMLPELNTFADKPSTIRRTDMTSPKFEYWPLIKTALPFPHYFTGLLMACHCYMLKPRICLVVSKVACVVDWDRCGHRIDLVFNRRVYQ